MHELLIEESVLGWKEFELEVMRDAADTFVVVCSIENLDPMGVHTGDSITVAPQMTLSDVEYQAMRDDAKKVIRAVGVATGGSNIQFAVHPKTGRRIVIEMNPRVSRSSALASKATGFPIAKIAALLAVGYRLDEIPNDITKKTPASFEPTLDYVVVKIPRFTFEKFPGADTTLGVQMKSVGEVMALGRTFAESFGKALRSLETGRAGWIDADAAAAAARAAEARMRSACRGPSGSSRSSRPSAPARRWRPSPRSRGSTRGSSTASRRSSRSSARSERRAGGALADAGLLLRAKRSGFSDPDLAKLSGRSTAEVRAARLERGVTPVFNRVDTCAAEFESRTPYLYSCYETEDESNPSSREKVIVLGSGPNRIGQGLEFDYCCVHAAEAITAAGYESVMINCNPETVSTDYDTSDRLYFEPLTFEDVMAVVEREKPKGVLVQFGGQTPLKLAKPLEAAGVPILGTTPDAIDRAEDRERFGELLRDVNLQAPPWGAARDVAEGLRVGRRLGFPLLVRPSYVLGGRAMRIAYDEEALENVLEEAIAAFPDRPVLIDRFLEDAYELDVDALGDGEHVVIAGVMQHIEEAGIHSGDSYAVLPPYRRVPRAALGEIRQATTKLGQVLEVVGLMNVQYAIRGGELFVLEVNPRASRTVPFVAKSTGCPSRASPRGSVSGDAARRRPHRGAARVRLFDQGPGVPVPALRGGRHDPRPGDAFDGRGHGARPQFRTRVPEGRAGRRDPPARKGQCLPLGARRRQGRSPPARARARRAGLPPPRDGRHGEGAREGRPHGGDRSQGERGASEHRGPHDQRPRRPHREHAPRQGVVLRRGRDPPHGPRPRRPVPHDALGRLGRARGHSGARRGRPHVRPLQEEVRV